MSKRYAAIWFTHLTTDWVIRRKAELRDVPFVLAAPERGRMIVKGANIAARSEGVKIGMVVADCRAILPTLQVLEDIGGLSDKVLSGLAEWCLRFTPIAAVDPPDGLILDISGCAHLWGGEQAYLQDISSRLRSFGYHLRSAIADTVGTAWGVSRFARDASIIEFGKCRDALLDLPPAALRLPIKHVERLEKLGLMQVRNFIDMPRAALRRRFGAELLNQLDSALGQGLEFIQPIRPVEAYQERLPCLEPIRTRKGIEIALDKLLEAMCHRLTQEEKGIRVAVFKGYRVDGNVQEVEIGTSRPSRDPAHLSKLFDLKIGGMEPDLGFELFVLEGRKVDDHKAELEQLWNIGKAEHEKDVAELLDRIAGKLGKQTVHRYLPAEHYWPERSVRRARSIEEQPQTEWRLDRPRPVHLLSKPEVIEVMVPLPDYPPVLFHYKGKPHRVAKADGPERIEQEWWLQEGEFRDYYCVEDEAGGRYWVFRLGSYATGQPTWYLHGFFA